MSRVSAALLRRAVNDAGNPATVREQIPLDQTESRSSAPISDARRADIAAPVTPRRAGVSAIAAPRREIA